MEEMRVLFSENEHIYNILLVFQGMEKIEQLDSRGFTEYLKQYQNTICGRYPIGVLLHVCIAAFFLKHKQYEN